MYYKSQEQTRNIQARPLPTCFAPSFAPDLDIIRVRLLPWRDRLARSVKDECERIGRLRAYEAAKSEGANMATLNELLRTSEGKAISAEVDRRIKVAIQPLSKQLAAAVLEIGNLRQELDALRTAVDNS